MQSKPPFGNSLNTIGLFFCINFYLIVIFGTKTFKLTIFDDDGAISILTICILLAAQLLVLYQMATAAKLIRRVDWLLLAYILQVYIMREADFHSSFTTSNVTKGSFYTDAANPLQAKLIAGSIFLLFLLAVIFLAFKYATIVLKALRHRAPWSIAALLWFSLLFVSQLLDKSALNHSPDLRIKNIEEMLEFSSAIFLLLAFISYLLDKAYVERLARSD
jgi:hypothetical protein